MHIMDVYDRLLTRIYFFTIIMLVTLAAIAYVNDSVFFTDAIISIFAITAVYHFRKSLVYSWEGALLCCLGWLMNTAGTLGAYDLSVEGFGWDKLLHFISITGLTILIYAYLQRKSELSVLEVVAITFFIAQGFGAINEIVEFIGSHYFNVGQGLFGMMNGLSEPMSNFDRFDTHWDMIINTLGILTGLLYIKLSAPARIVARAPV